MQGESQAHRATGEVSAAQGEQLASGEQAAGGAAAFSAPRGWWTSDSIDRGAFDGPAHLRWWLHRISSDGGQLAAPSLTDAERVALAEFEGLADFQTWSAWLDRAREQLRRWEVTFSPRCEAKREPSLAERMRRLGWTVDGQLFRVSDGEGGPLPAAQVLLALVEAAEHRALASFSMADVTPWRPALAAPSRTAGAVERTLRKLPEPASYETDGAAIAAVLRKVHGDEATEVAMLINNGQLCKEKSRGYVTAEGSAELERYRAENSTAIHDYGTQGGES